ncbi:MAG TPA: hypothetical protein VFV76_15330 [Actinomycetes bacterium]|nr:hypothetical protein [Actinomycetes bacterium]
MSVSQIPGSPEEDVTSALTDPDAEGLPEPLVDVDRLISGGPSASRPPSRRSSAGNG